MKLLDTKDYLEMRREALFNDGAAPGSSYADSDLIQWDTTRYTDWQKQLIGGPLMCWTRNLESPEEEQLPHLG